VGGRNVKEDCGGAGELEAGSDGGRGGLIVNEGMDCAQMMNAFFPPDAVVVCLGL